MEAFLASPATRQNIEQLVANPSHAVALVGSIGTGKAYSAQFIASKLLDQPISKLASHPYFRIIQPAARSISIDSVRAIKQFLSLKALGKGSIKRIVIIEDAHYLTEEAQNALLKILEEPPIDTIIILTVTNKDSLLPTVLSRSQQVQIQPISLKEAEKFKGGDKFSQSQIEKAFNLSGGRAGLFLALLTEKNHPLIDHIQSAKQLITMSPYERLVLINELVKDKPALQELLDAMAIIAEGTLPVTKQVERWHNIAKHIYVAQTSLNKNVSAKLVLTELFLEL